MNLLITNYHPHGGGGHTTYILSLARNLQRYDINPIVACPAGSRLYDSLTRDGNIKVIANDFPNSIKEIRGVFRSVSKLRTIVKENNIDVIHVNGSPDHWLAVYYKTFFRSDIPVVRTRHGMQPVKDHLSAKFQNNRTSATILVCAAQQKLCSGKRAFEGHQIFVIPNGVDHEHFSPRPKSVEIREQYGLKNGDVVIGSTAGLGSYKGIPEFLTAAAPVIKEKQNIKILLVGAVNRDNPYRTLAEKLGISGNVIFTGFQADTREYASVFDFGFVFSKAIETISFAAREMMMMGKPVIVSDFGGLAENVIDGVNGFVIKQHSAVALQEVLGRIARDKELASRMGAKAGEKAGRDFRLEGFLKKTSDVYKIIRGI